MPDPSTGADGRLTGREAAAELLTIPYCPLVPTQRQAVFLCDLGPEALYGGAAGGGKSVALLMAALQFVEVPGYSALILRRIRRLKPGVAPGRPDLQHGCGPLVV